jgi:hypothetical protein
MKIVLKGVGDDKPEEKLVLSDDGYDAPGWIDITIGDETIGIHINDLMPAMDAFETKYYKQKEA